MFPADNRFFDALRGEAFEQVLVVDVLAGGTVVASTGALNPAQDIAVIGANVSMSRRGLVSRQASLSVVDLTGGLLPLTSDDLLDSRSGNEVRLHAGFRTHTGTYTVPVATVGIDMSAITEHAGAMVVEISGRDRMAALAEPGWASTHVVTAGTPLNDFLVDLLAMFAPHAGTVLADTDHLLPAMTLGGTTGDPAADASRAAEAAGLELYFDGQGMMRTRPWPDPATVAPSWEYGLDGYDLLEWPVRSKVDRRTARNGVIVTGSAPWLIVHVQGEAWQTNPNLPLWHDPALDPGTPGMSPPMPERVENALVGSDAAATAAAAAKLPDVLGADEVGELVGAPNYAQEAGDVIAVQSPVYGVGVDGRPAWARTVVDDITLSLDVGGRMQLTTRRRVLT